MADINQTIKVASTITFLFGLWLIAAPWVLAYDVREAIWNDVIVGLLVVLMAGIRLSNPIRYVATSWVNVALGLWLLIAPFFLHYKQDLLSGVDKALWNDVAVGIFVVVLSWLSATMTSKPE